MFGSFVCLKLTHNFYIFYHHNFKGMCGITMLKVGFEREVIDIEIL